MRNVKRYDVTRQTERNRASGLGKLFQAFHKFSVGAGQTYNIIYKTGDNKTYSYPSVIVTSKDKVTFEYREDADYAGGDVVETFCQNRVDNTVSQNKMFSNVTVVDAGNKIAQAFLPGAEGVGQSRSGTVGGGGDTHWILKPNTNYLIRFINNSTQDNDIQVNEIWIEGDKE